MKNLTTSFLARTIPAVNSRWARYSALVALFGVALTGNVTASTDTWTGGGANPSWTNPSNWGGTAPVAGDDLAFGGTTQLTNTNSFTAATTFNSITFNSGAGAFTLNGNSVTLGTAGGNITDNSTSLETVNIPLILTGTSTISVSPGTAGSLTVSGAISGTGALIIAGNGAAGSSTVSTTGATTITLSGTNSFSGPTTLTGGGVTLAFGASNANKLDAASALTLGGSNGGVGLTISGTATQSVASTVIAAGNSSIILPSGDTLNLGSVSGTDGGVLALVYSSTAVNGTLTASSNANGILGGFAIYTSSAGNPTTIDWVASTGSGTAATLGDYTGYNTGAASGWGATSNVSVSANQTYTGTINSLKFTNSVAADTATLSLTGTATIATGGILIGTGTTTATISGGTLTTSAADLYIYGSGSTNSLLISSAITGSEGIVVSPTSANTGDTVTLSGALSFGGNIAVTRSTLVLDSALPTGTTGKTITLNTVVGSSVNTTLQDGETAGTLTINSANYQIVGNGGVTKNNNAASTLALLGTHSYTGVTTDSGGIIQVDTLANGGVNSSIGASSSLAGNLVLGTGATLQYIGSGASTDRLFTLSGSTNPSVTLDGSGTGAVNFTNAGSINYTSSVATTATLTLTGTYSGSPNTLSAAIATDGAGTTKFVKTGTGAWAVSGENSYNGGTTISAGTLYANGGAGTISSTVGTATTASSTTVTVASTAGLMVGQSVTGTGISANTYILAVTSPTTFTLSATATASGSTSLTYGALNYSAFGGGNVSVAASATLAGNGTIAPNAGNSVTLAAGANLTPGGVQATVPFTGTAGTAANGSLTLTPASTGTIMSITSANLTFALGAGGATSGSQLIIGGSSANIVAFSGTSTVSINDLVGASLTLYQEYELIDGNPSTSFTGLTLASSATGTLGFQITGGLQLLAANTAGNFYSQWYNTSELFYNPTTNSIDIEVVPEPSTWALMLGGLGLLVFWQRRHRRG